MLGTRSDREWINTGSTDCVTCSASFQHFVHRYLESLNCVKWLLQSMSLLGNVYYIIVRPPEKTIEFEP